MLHNSPSQKIYLTYKYDNKEYKNDEIEVTVNRIAMVEPITLQDNYEKVMFVLQLS